MVDNQSKKYAKQYLAVQRAKSFYQKVEDEPEIPAGKVRLRELTHALELLMGLTLDTRYDYIPEAYQLVLESLRTGQLVAFTASIGETIPRPSWPQDCEEVSAYHMGFWLGIIDFENECAGFKGALPVVLLDDAVKWLKSVTPSAPSGAPKKHDIAARAYRRIYPGGHKKKHPRVTQDSAAKRVSEEIGQTVSWVTISRGLKASAIKT